MSSRQKPLSPRMMMAGTVLRMVHRQEIVSLDLVEGGDAELASMHRREQLDVLERVEPEQYLLGIQEVPFSWHREALKTQVVALLKDDELVETAAPGDEVATAG